MLHDDLNDLREEASGHRNPRDNSGAAAEVAGETRSDTPPVDQGGDGVEMTCFSGVRASARRMFGFEVEGDRRSLNANTPNGYSAVSSMHSQPSAEVVVPVSGQADQSQPQRAKWQNGLFCSGGSKQKTIGAIEVCVGLGAFALTVYLAYYFMTKCAPTVRMSASDCDPSTLPAVENFFCHGEYFYPAATQADFTGKTNCTMSVEQIADSYTTVEGHNNLRQALSIIFGTLLFVTGLMDGFTRICLGRTYFNGTVADVKRVCCPGR